MGNSWYDYTTDRCWRGSAPDRVSYTQFVEQRQRLIGVLEEAHRQLPPGGRLVLGGLSQGAALALDVMLHAPSHIDSIAGVFCSRGMMQDETRYNLQDDKVAHRAKRCPIFVFHGKLDHTVPWRLARRSYRWLTENQFEVTICAESGVTHATDSLLEYQGIAQFVSNALQKDNLSLNTDTKWEDSKWYEWDDC